jgi:hypothetical protein
MPMAILLLGKYPYYPLAWRLDGPQRILAIMDNRKICALAGSLIFIFSSSSYPSHDTDCVQKK